MTVHVFDFDGVLAHPVEDAIFRLEDCDAERQFLADAADSFGLPQYSNQKYLRHVVVQHVMFDAGVPCLPGPLLDTARESGLHYILSARSSAPAVARALEFLSHHELYPAETFFVGNGGKNPNLTWICQEADDEVVFWDDTMSHIDKANELKLPNLRVEFVDTTKLVNEEMACKLYDQIITSFYGGVTQTG